MIDLVAEIILAVFRLYLESKKGSLAPKQVFFFSGSNNNLAK